MGPYFLDTQYYMNLYLGGHMHMNLTASWSTSLALAIVIIMFFNSL